MTWAEAIPTFKSNRHQALLETVQALRLQEKVYPPQSDILRIFEACPLENVKVVILGQDPYHGEGQANGFAFAVNEGIKIPPSLRNIFKELKADIGIDTPSSTLSNWVEQGVFLLNNSLSVFEAKPNSHQHLGWERLSDETIAAISSYQAHVVFILWGAFAQKKKGLIDTNKHLIIESVHPSPLSASRGFFGSKPFSKANQYLVEHNIPPINW